MTNRRFLLVLPFFLGLALGCGSAPPNAPSSVSGKITYKGAPVTAGNVMFYPKEGGAITMAIEPDGTYSGTDLPLGEGDVTIETESANKKPATYGGGKQQMGPKPEGHQGTDPGAYVKIPAKYADRKTSKLTMSLAKGKNEQNFELTD